MTRKLGNLVRWKYLTRSSASMAVVISIVAPALAADPAKEYLDRDLYLPYPGNAAVAPENVGTSVGAFIAALKAGSWEKIEDQENGWIYRIQLKDQLTGKESQVSLQFEPSPVGGGIELSRGVSDGAEMSSADIYTSFASVIANVKQEHAVRVAAAANVQSEVAKQAQANTNEHGQQDASTTSPRLLKPAEATATTVKPGAPPETPNVPVKHVTPSHCTPGETVLFSCQLERTKKIVSLCSSSDLSPTAGYVQYRFGPPGNVEIMVPPTNARPSGFYILSHTQQIRSSLYELSFNLGKIGYTMSRQFVGADDSQDSVSLIAKKSGKALFSDLCAGTIKDTILNGSDGPYGLDHLAKLMGSIVVEKEDMN
jgi:hypothetical protein